MSGEQRRSAKVFVINGEGEILLLRRTEVRDRGKYDLPGGGVEQGMTPIEGACQELVEEVGLIAQVDELAPALPEPLVFKCSKGKPVELHFFRWDYNDAQDIVLGGGDLAPNHKPEHDDYFWADPQTVLDRSDIQLTDSVRQAIGSFF